MEGTAPGTTPQWLIERERSSAAQLRCHDWSPPEIGGGDAPRPTTDDERDRLVRTIEAEIIPRLMLAHRLPMATVTRMPRRAVVEAHEVDELTRCALDDDFASMTRFVDAMREKGISLEVLCGDLFAPAARGLGEMWESDTCDFMQVTLGLWCLQKVLREASAGFYSDLAQADRGLQALLIPAPGEQHTLGLSMVVEFFSRAGWEVVGTPPATTAELCAIVSTSWFDVVGLSVSSEHRIEAVAESVRAVRGAALNRDVAVLIGGAVFVQRPELAARIGADMTVVNGIEGPIAAARLLAMRANRTAAG